MTDRQTAIAKCRDPNILTPFQMVAWAAFILVPLVLLIIACPNPEIL